MHPHCHQQVPPVSTASISRPSRSALFVDDTGHDGVEELGDGEPSKQIDEEKEEVGVSQADLLRGLTGLWAGVLQSSKKDEPEHVLVISNLPHKELDPGRQTGDGRRGQSAAAVGERVHPAAVPVVCEHSEEPHCVASVEDLILQHSRLGHISHLSQRILHQLSALRHVLIGQVRQGSQVDLAVCQLGQCIRGHEVFGHVVRGQVVLAVGLQLLHLFGAQGGGHPGKQVSGLSSGHDANTGKACASPSLQQATSILRASGETLDSRLNLLRLHTDPTNLHLPVRPSNDLDLPRLPPTKVTRHVHAAVLGQLQKFLGCGLGEVPVSIGELAAEDNLSSATRGDLLALLVQDPHRAPRLRSAHRRHLSSPHPCV
mmetsp:Transcript_91152/g.208966  ORF Transcript_91152/g.208966 Transcript_91152/m.208966 type:complete len:372 (+) Transcript_91152:943-2058(+)